MNPDTKQFVDLTPDALGLLTGDTRRQAEVEIEEATRDWPKFRTGDEYELNGVRFRIQRVGRREIVLQPVDDVRFEPSRQRKR